MVYMRVLAFVIRDRWRDSLYITSSLPLEDTKKPLDQADVDESFRKEQSSYSMYMCLRPILIDM